MTNSPNLEKKTEQLEYRARLLEAELFAVKRSKAYKVSKAIGMLKNQVKSDPVGLTKKAARMLFTEPKKLTHIIRSGKRSAFIAQSINDQTNKYQEWIILNEPDETEFDEQRKQSNNFAFKPVISIITPVYNPPVEILEELIGSVLDQTYPYFELCLGDDYGNNEEVISLIKKYANLDNRIRFFSFDENRGIAGASNKLLSEAKGEYIALLDHDDTFSPNALFENVALLNEKPYDFIYSDKDKIDINGNRFDPLFKPQYSPEMMLNVNYLTHLNVMRTKIVRDSKGWSTDTDGAQDWDLFLRVVRSSKYIGHIPKILYHWRVIDTSTAASIEAKPYALAGQRKAVDNYLKSEKIPAISYHNKTELFLMWDKRAIDKRPVVFIQYTNLHNTLRTVRNVSRAIPESQLVVLVESNVLDAQTENITKISKVKTLSYTNETIIEVIGAYCENIVNTNKESTVIVLKDLLRLPGKNNWYDNLTGWLSIKGVGAVSGRIINRHDLIIDSGGIVTSDYQYFPIFYKYPKYYQSYIGNAEWVRNLSAISSNFTATKLSILKEYLLLDHGVNYGNFDDYISWISENRRIVLSPQATALIHEDHGINLAHPFASSKLQLNVLKGYQDKFGNPNMSPSDPMRLFADEPIADISKLDHGPIDRYQHDATILVNTFDISQDELVKNRAIVENKKVLKKPTSVAWILPSYEAVYAGLMNIFSFANYLQEKQHLKTTIYILKDSDDVSVEKKQAISAFSMLSKAAFIGIRPNEAYKIKYHDIGIATQWATTFPLAKTASINRKCYFIQDNESNFYPKGTVSSLVDLSYRFGFTAIANTDGLLDMYKKNYNGSGVVVKSIVDLSTYTPRKNVHYTPKMPYKVFFYARPNMPRNAFELGIAGLSVLKKQLGKNIEIITAGAEWNASSYGVEGLFTNLGKISYEAVPRLYRSVDAGLMFMFSGHPGVTASELMASGCPVVVNEYDDTTWHELYKNEDTCLVTIPTASEVARNIRRLLEDYNLRKKLIDNGLKLAKHFYKNYDKACEEAYYTIIDKLN